ncbi:hypothetical protein HB780_01135 (plasmid) [Rhizobium lusitanum]|uniref:hypothetical protein n=1 Tax=Rhizobium lusitanum TaxID=293958 RepID=UPI00161D4B32|nr:hypothetical protein [Rhizobium lusitanum]QND44438.1 hypothetical protein HB780_01135 [Rhizobium lusitanum]
MDNRLSELRSGKDKDLNTSHCLLTVWQSGTQVHRTKSAVSDYPAAVQALASKFRNADFIHLEIVSPPPASSSKSLRQMFERRSDGLYAVEIATDSATQYIYASDILTDNIGLRDRVKEFVTNTGCDLSDPQSPLSLDARFSQMKLFIPTSGRYLDLHRGSAHGIFFSSVEAATKALAELLIQWALNNASPDGSLPYKVYPSGRRLEPTHDNPIRQWMTTWALATHAKKVNDEELLRIVTKNIKYNMRKFYKAVGEIGLMEHNSISKLGASAVAALAIFSHEGNDGLHRAELKALLAGISCQWTASGRFKTFFSPSNWSGNQNFYPGETLLLWSTLLDYQSTPELKEKFETSTSYYKEFFRNNPNPAFVPWHTMAQFKAFCRDENSDRADYIFEMNDFLVAIQQNDISDKSDLTGSFYDPARPEYGPPHASSTAIYVESLIHALKIARHQNDKVRETRYLNSILLGFNNLNKLQFKSEAELFYVADKRRAFGGLRSNPFDNIIRIDNIQHALAACNAWELIGSESSSGN